jgi:hypothetical protein
VLFIQGSGKINNDAAKASRSGLMVAFTREIGRMTRLAAKANSFTRMVMSTKVNGLTTKLTGMGSTCTITVPNIQAIGKMINSMGRARKHGQVLVEMINF